MNTISNALPSLPFIFDSGIRFMPSSSIPVKITSETSPEIKITFYKIGTTRIQRRQSSLTVLAIPKDTEISGWRLKSVMLVQVSCTRKESVATIWLENVVEYGVGKEDNEAIIDLIVSIGEYKQSLEKLEKKLGDSSRKDLENLCKLIEPASSS